MFELDIEMLKEQGLQLVDSAKKTAQDLADKGKNKPVSYTHLTLPTIA